MKKITLVAGILLTGFLGYSQSSEYIVKKNTVKLYEDSISIDYKSKHLDDILVISKRKITTKNGAKAEVYQTAEYRVTVLHIGKTGKRVLVSIDKVDSFTKELTTVTLY